MPSFLSLIRKSFLTLAVMTLPLAAQTGLGTVTGTVFDSSKAIVPQASLVLVETATGISKKASTNGSGIYYFGSLPVGPYHLVVEAPGFAKWETDFRVDAGQTVTVDPALAVGTVQSRLTYNPQPLKSLPRVLN